jgi:hypothetical protein
MSISQCLTAVFELRPSKRKAAVLEYVRSETEKTFCSYEQHADLSASIIIARRGLMKITKGVKLDDLHKNMVTSLNESGDTGLGPLTELVDG